MLHRARHRLKVKQFALPRRSEYKGIFTGRHPCIIVELSDPTMPAPPQGLEGIIFRGRKGNPWHRSSISSAMTRIRRRARRAGQTAPSCLYGLRHRFAARCIRQNINVRIVASLLGHKTMRMLEHYTASISADIDLLKTELAKVKLG
jgi:integrase